MEDKIRLLMETADCNQYEAELAYKSARGNFIEALDFLNKITPRLSITKCIFRTREFLYGIFLCIYDVKQQSLLTATAVVSKNPVIYEYDIEKEWEDVGKFIYSCRLNEGALSDISNALQEKITRIYDSLEMPFNDENIRPVLEEALKAKDVELKVVYGEEPYKTESHVGEEETAERPVTDRIILDVELLPDENGSRAGTLSKGDVVWVRIVDRREIGEYLSMQLGCLNEGKILPIAAQVSEVEKQDGKVVIECWFKGSIVGQTLVGSEEKVKVVSVYSPEDSGKFSVWFRKILNIKKV